MGKIQNRTLDFFTSDNKLQVLSISYTVLFSGILSQSDDFSGDYEQLVSVMITALDS